MTGTRFNERVQCHGFHFSRIGSGMAVELTTERTTKVLFVELVLRLLVSVL